MSGPPVSVFMFTAAALSQSLAAACLVLASSQSPFHLPVAVNKTSVILYSFPLNVLNNNQSQLKRDKTPVSRRPPAAAAGLALKI